VYTSAGRCGGSGNGGTTVDHHRCVGDEAGRRGGEERHHLSDLVVEPDPVQRQPVDELVLDLLDRLRRGPVLSWAGVSTGPGLTASTRIP
jgi:hypothetical protein